MAQETYSYSFANSILTIDGQRVGSFGDGDDVIKITPSAPLVEVIKGADGTTVYAVTADKGWNVEITLMAASPTNAIFRAMANTMQRVGAVVSGRTMNLTDIINRDRFTGIKGAMTEMPELARGAKPGTLVWKFHFADGDMTQITAPAVGAV